MFLFITRFGCFALQLNLEDAVKYLGGEIINALMGINYKVFANVAFGCNSTYLDVNFDYWKDLKRAKID